MTFLYKLISLDYQKRGGETMKKILCMMLCFAAILSLSACSYSVPAPMQYPNYTFTDEPDTMELRMTAVRAMRDILSIQWCTNQEIRYHKNGPVNHKEFVHEPRNTYAGLLYSSANTGIFQFFEYYNTETGCLEYNGSPDELKLELGSSCADALLWAWSTVCNSIKGGFYPVMMVPSNGYRVVGDYTYRESILSYNEMPSYAIIDNNPKELIIDAYAKTLPADALVTTSDNHAMMVIEAPTIVYLEDGSIDAANSYLIIQDQRAGGATFYESKVDGHTLYFSGRTSAKYTFDELYEGDYIPVTAAEFIGEDPYEKASVTATNYNYTNIEELQSTTIEANYPLAVINLISTDADGNDHVLLRQMLGGAYAQGVPRSVQLRDLDGIDNLALDPGSIVKIEVVVSTGERFYPIEFTA